MKNKYWIIICVFCLALGAGGYAFIDYKFFPCPVPDKTTIEQGPEKPPVITDNKNPYACGKTIKLDYVETGPKAFRIKAYNDCMSVYRDYNISYYCPMPKWTLAIGILGGAGYQPELKTVDALIGLDVNLYRHYKKFSIGGGVWYMQSMTTQYKAGGLKADFLFSFGKQ
jgi:hypothetical protein